MTLNMAGMKTSGASAVTGENGATIACRFVWPREGRKVIKQLSQCRNNNRTALGVEKWRNAVPNQYELGPVSGHEVAP